MTELEEGATLSSYPVSLLRTGRVDEFVHFHDNVNRKRWNYVINKII